MFVEGSGGTKYASSCLIAMCIEPDEHCACHVPVLTNRSYIAFDGAVKSHDLQAKSMRLPIDLESWQVVSANADDRSPKLGIHTNGKKKWKGHETPARFPSIRSWTSRKGE